MKDSCIVCKSKIGGISNYGREGDHLCFDCSNKMYPCVKCGGEIVYGSTTGRIGTIVCKECKERESLQSLQEEYSKEPTIATHDKPKLNIDYKVNILLAATFGFISGVANILFPLLTSYLSLKDILSATIVTSLSVGVLKNSRACAILLFAYYLLAQSALIISGKGNVNAISAVFIITFYLGITGTFSFHKYKKAAIPKPCAKGTLANQIEVEKTVVRNTKRGDILGAGKLLTVWVFTIFMVVNLTFVPWVFISKHERNRNTIRQAGYSWVFSAPTVPAVSTSTDYYGSSKVMKYEGFPVEFWSVQIDQYKLLTQSFAIIILFSALYFTLYSLHRKIKL